MKLYNKWKDTTFKLHFQFNSLMKATLNHENEKVVHHAYNKANT